jgi:hypothetical protein
MSGVARFEQGGWSRNPPRALCARAKALHGLPGCQLAEENPDQAGVWLFGRQDHATLAVLLQSTDS